MKFIEVFRNKCFELLRNSEKRSQRNKNEQFTVSEYGSLVYLEQYHSILHTLVDEIFSYKLEIGENYSSEFVKNKINDFIISLQYNKNTDKSAIIDAFFDTLKNDLSASREYIIPEYIENLSIQFKFKIGRVQFIPFSKKNYEKIFYDNGYVKNKDFDLLDTPKEFKDFYNIKCVAYCSVNAGEEIKAHEKGANLIEEALSVIRFFNIYQNFGILGNYNSPRKYEGNLYNKETKTIHASMVWKDRTGNCHFTKERFKVLKEEAGLKNLNLILKKDKSKRTDLENKLLVSIRWFSEILKHRAKNEDNLFRLFTALESLLIQDKNEEKKKNLAERLAFINYSNKEARLFVHKLVEKLYTLRSELVHEGKTKFKEIDFNTLQSQLQQCIINISTKIDKYPNLSDWLNMITDAKFSKKLEFQKETSPS